MGTLARADCPTGPPTCMGPIRQRAAADQPAATIRHAAWGGAGGRGSCQAGRDPGSRPVSLRRPHAAVPAAGIWWLMGRAALHWPRGPAGGPAARLWGCTKPGGRTLCLALCGGLWHAAGVAAGAPADDPAAPAGAGAATTGRACDRVCAGRRSVAGPPRRASGMGRLPECAWSVLAQRRRATQLLRAPQRPSDLCLSVSNVQCAADGMFHLLVSIELQTCHLCTRQQLTPPGQWTPWTCFAPKHTASSKVGELLQSLEGRQAGALARATVEPQGPP